MRTGTNVAQTRLVAGTGRRRGLGIMLVSSLVGVILSAGCGGSSSHSSGFVNTRPADEEPFSREIELHSQTALRLEASSGTIAVTGTPGAASISITGVRRVEANTLEDATAHLAELDVEVDSSSPTEVVVRTVQPERELGRNYIVNYTIVLPEGLDVDVDTFSGDITVRSIKADVRISSWNGRIQAEAIAGNADLSLWNGHITASVTLPPGGQIDMTVWNGNIDLTTPQTTSALFDARVGMTGRITLTNLWLSNETVTPGWRSGTLGGGDGRISLGVTNGTIHAHGS